MLEIKIDLIPYGIQEERRTISHVRIINDGTSIDDTGNYEYLVEDGTLKIKGTLKGFKRTKKSALHLLRDVLNKAL